MITTALSFREGFDPRVDCYRTQLFSDCKAHRRVGVHGVSREELMKERPILMSSPMVRCLLAGTKTQTRRVINPQPVRSMEIVKRMPDAFEIRRARGWRWRDLYVSDESEHSFAEFVAAYARAGKPGDRLWVRETWGWRSDAWFYRADYDDGAYPDFRWRPSIFMPRAASRITLELTDVRVERLQDISEADAMAEGIRCEGSARAPSSKYAVLWDSLNGKKPGCSWADNPWVWALSFRVLESATQPRHEAHGVTRP